MFPFVLTVFAAKVKKVALVGFFTRHVWKLCNNFFQFTRFSRDTFATFFRDIDNEDLLCLGEKSPDKVEHGGRGVLAKHNDIPRKLWEPSSLGGFELCPKIAVFATIISRLWTTSCHSNAMLSTSHQTRRYMILENVPTEQVQDVVNVFWYRPQVQVGSWTQVVGLPLFLPSDRPSTKASICWHVFLRILLDKIDQPVAQISSLHDMKFWPDNQLPGLNLPFPPRTCPTAKHSHVSTSITNIRM